MLGLLTWDFSRSGHEGLPGYRMWMCFPQAKGVAICGVEITEGAVGVQSHPFTGSTAFVLGNEVCGHLSTCIGGRHHVKLWTC